MTERVFVRPAEGRSVRHERTMQHIPAAGTYVERTSYIVRRIAAGDLIEGEPKAVKPAAVANKTETVKD